MTETTLRIDKSSDNRSVRLTFSDERDSAEMVITAQELSTIIALLANARASLMPPVPASHIDAPILKPVRLNAVIPAERIQGRRNILFRHPGLGWSAFDITAEDGATLIAGISAVMHADRTRPPP